jgi:hypothetical protein
MCSRNREHSPAGEWLTLLFAVNFFERECTPGRRWPVFPG